MDEPLLPSSVNACPRCLVLLHPPYQQPQLGRKRIDDPAFLVQFAPKLSFEVEEPYRVCEQRGAWLLPKHPKADLPHEKHAVKAPPARQKYVLPPCQVGIKRERPE